MARTYTKKTKVTDTIIIDELKTNPELLKLPIPKREKTFVVIDTVIITITDDKFYNDDIIKKEFIEVYTEFKNSEVLDRDGNLVFREHITSGVDENGEKVDILSYEKLTRQVKEKLTKKLYTKTFNVKDIKIEDINLNKYFDENKTMVVNGIKAYTTRFDGWIPEFTSQPNNKVLLHLFVR
jgi:hypothetical protein